MADENDARERALAEYRLARISWWTYADKSAIFRAGYDAARAESERKVDDERKRVVKTERKLAKEVVETERQWAKEVIELTRDKEAMQHERDGYYDDWQKAEAQVRELEQEHDVWQRAADGYLTRAEKAEARVRDLEQLNAKGTALLELAEARVVELECWGNDCHAQWTAAESALATERERNAKLSAELENVKAGRDAHKAASDERYDELQKVRAELDQLRKDYAAVKAAWEGRG